MTFQTNDSAEGNLRPRAWFRPRSIHWVVLQYACIAGVILGNGAHGFGAHLALPMLGFTFIGVVHACVEIAFRRLRGRVPAWVTLTLLLIPFTGMLLSW